MPESFFSVAPGTIKGHVVPGTKRASITSPATIARAQLTPRKECQGVRHETEQRTVEYKGERRSEMSSRLKQMNVETPRDTRPRKRRERSMSALPCLVRLECKQQENMDAELTRHMKGKLDDLVSLRKALKGKYWVIDNSGNGNCFFAALLHNAEVNGVPGMATMTVSELRNLIADEMENATYIDTWLSKDEKAEKIARTRRQFEWVDGQEVHAAASRVLHCNITIVAVDMGVRRVAECESAQWEARLGYVSRNHYVSLMMVVDDKQPYSQQEKLVPTSPDFLD